MKRIFSNRWIHFGFLFCLLVWGVFISNPDSRFREELRFAAFDSLNRMMPRERPDVAVIVDIDDASLAEFGQWPWPRTVLAGMIRNLTALGAKSIAFDGVLAEPDRTSPARLAESLPQNFPNYESLKEDLSRLGDHDQELARAIAESERFVSGFTFGNAGIDKGAPRVVQQLFAPKAVKDAFLLRAFRFEDTARFLPELESVAAGNGSFMASPEDDGILRRTGTIFTDGRTLYPSLSLEALRIAQDPPRSPLRIVPNKNLKANEIDTPYRLQVAGHDVPVEANGMIWLYYRYFHERDDYVPAYKVLHGLQDPDVRKRIEGKIVFIGSSAEGLKDLRSTPLQAFRPGVEIHVNAAEQIVQGKYLLRPDITKYVEQTFILVVGLLMILLAPFANAVLLAVLCGALVVLGFTVSYLGYVHLGVLLDPIYPGLSVFSIFVVSMLFTYIRAETERQAVRDAFGLYISPDFMAELTRDPDKLKLGGETRDLSIMFTDIRNFTTLSESMPPERLINLMNDFLTPMSDLVMENRGTIDKYMGDAMMAFWNAPLDDAEHAAHACLTAIRMEEALAPINASLREEALAEGRSPVVLKAGIGINTGRCAVGNMGSRKRFAYSALGDTVNLASRLEGQTKAYGVSILVSEETQRQAPGFAALELDLIQVKGKFEAVRIYTLLGDTALRETPLFAKWEALHTKMLAHYRAQDFDAALAHIADCRAASEGRLDEYYAIFEERIALLKITPPPAEWDGVYVAQTK